MRDSQSSEKLFANGLAEVLSLARSRSYAQALARVAELTTRFPTRTEPLLQWAVLLRLAGKPGARDLLGRCIALDPGNGTAHRLLGEVAAEEGAIADALAYLEAAARLAPDDPRACIALARTRALANDGEGALATLAAGRRRFGEAADLADLEARLQAGRGAWHATVSALKVAGESDPRSVSRLGDALLQLGQPAAAYLAYRRAERGLGGCPSTGSRALFASQFLACNPDVRLAAHRRWARAYAALPRREVPLRDPRPDRGLRIGLVSPRFRSSSAAFLLSGLIANWPAGLSLHCYAEQDEEDLTTQRIRTRCADWVRTRGVDDADLSDRIADDRIDILIDLAGHTPGNRLTALARRPAPLILSWLDYCDTTGSEAFDGVITDSLHNARGGAHRFAERLLRLDPLRFSYQPPDDPPCIAPAGASSRAPVFGAFHRFAKLSPPVLNAWRRVLEELPGANLIIRNDALLLEAEHDRYREWLAAAGLPIERVALKAALPHRDYLAAYEEIDLVLDTFPYNGGVTTLEALLMGRPVVTLTGTTLISRQSAAILHAMGLQELVASDLDQYVRLAKELASDKRRLASLSRGLRQQMLQSPVCDASGFAQRFADLLRGAWRARCQGRPVGEAT